ncbi:MULTISPECIES: hypothetical protein [Mycobacterium]|uniref:Uncharacterized protein n=2 Tax=Mycobacterium intracellulare TaxID=1767 RepID=A0AAE4UBU6_MYCIT|nr:MULTISPECIES: hypothetical protein [Mycobacterium]MCA2321990.1 hypothetical protein [Mycobacterium intracellulare]MCA2342832.1 hypothetical protein [Mycobacterium intracellulare]MDV6979605.1 hypothetical protein [Mycobacterium intracellulare]MDV6985048.1 hypothetical protein [Mycobacterium intracellulare]MDV7015521.1 hypothetical protein [Mycobacterium intracellulare]
MSSEHWEESDVCEICGGPVAVLMKRDYAHGGIPVRSIVQRVLCLNGCLGQVMSPERVMNRGA